MPKAKRSTTRPSRNAPFPLAVRCVQVLTGVGKQAAEAKVKTMSNEDIVALAEVEKAFGETGSRREAVKILFRADPPQPSQPDT